uniref:protein YeeZ n=1 Tax=Erigeron canadensis TaxID=72917 RepID=UPI001CB9D3E4|nr:protein YeeZ [Erigeron canadensis]
MEVCPLPAVRFPASSLRYRPSSFRATKLQLCYASSSSTKEIPPFGHEERNINEKQMMFIMGLGFVGEFVAKNLINQGWDVSGTCTSVAKMDRLKKLGLNLHLFDANHPKLEVLDIMNEHTHLLVSIPPCKDIGDPMLQHAELLRRKLGNERLQWLCYLSTTGVYGDCGGAWVDENYQPNPPSELAKLRLAAEEGWLTLGRELGLAAHVFRLGGIYGPGRSAIDTIIKRGPLSDAQSVRSFKKYTSRVHVADICNALNASIQNPFPGRIYNIVDDDPAPRTEVFSYAHKLYSEKWPSQIKNVVSPAPVTNKSSTKVGRLKGDKRVVNERMKKELGVRLIHPSYRSGLQSICDQMHDFPTLSPGE